tara:strand:- start:4248 stop:4685 length:438 start_codon:yes stop_codon:yes gene_type:complete
MGLDMYLRGDKFITTFDDTKRDKDGKALRVKRPVVDGFDVETHVLDLGTWRKFAPLHVYIVNEFADGVDECQKIDLSAGELRKIAKALRNNKLPKNDDCHGCFFGDDEWWDELKSEGEKHAKVFDKAAEWVESTFWNNVTYQASW